MKFIFENNSYYKMKLILLFFIMHTIFGNSFIYSKHRLGINTRLKKQYLNKIKSEEKKRSLRILVVIDKFPWYTRSNIVNQITGLIDCGHDVHIYARGKKMSEIIEPEVLKYDLLSKTYRQELPPNLDSYDIILCQYGSEGKNFIKIKNKYNLKAKLVTCIRGGDITSKRELEQCAYDELFEKGDLFLPVCDYFKRRLTSLGCDSKKICEHHSAINCLRFSFKKRSFNPGRKIRIVSVNRLHEEKGMEYSIKAIARLIKKHSNLEYIIVGDGPLKKDLEVLINKLKVEPWVKMLGWQSQDEIVKILDDAHIFVLASVTAARGAQEGIPNALKEAMAMGLPVVSTLHAGIPELVEDGVSGFLVPERDVDSLEKKLAYLIKHPDVWQKMGRAGRSKVLDKFEMKKVNSKLSSMLKALK